jgi:hypothetical protein
MAKRSSTQLAAAVLVALLVGGLMTLALQAGANHEPANKVSASSSTIEVTGPNQEVVLLSERVKTSKPTDLILGVTLECSITTDVATTGNDEALAAGALDVWIEIDGNPVLINPTDQDGGVVTFCNRSYQRTTSMFDDDDATIETFFRTKDTHGFNWSSLDLGSATHTIQVLGELTQEEEGDATAEVVVGDRTLVVEPVKSANDEAITDLSI